MANYRLTSLSDYTGGLNLRADQLQLAPNESPDLLNVDVDPRGGVHSRWGVSPYITAVLSDPISDLFEFTNSTGTHQVVAAYGNKVAFWNGSSWTQIGSTATVTKIPTFTLYDDTMYSGNGTDGMLKWDGSTASRLADVVGNWSPDFAAPGTGHAPIGTCIASHRDQLWVANTLESGVRHPNRIRFSHPLKPEAWRETDFIDLPGDGDEIVALVPFRESLLIFKRDAVYVIYGYDWSSFAVQEITREAGSVNAQSVAATPFAAFFFDYPHGVMMWDGKQLTSRFDPLVPLIQTNDLLNERLAEVRVGWVRDRLWVTIPSGAGTDAYTYVYDPRLQKGRGVWVKYGLKFSAFTPFAVPAGDALWLGCMAGTDKVLLLEQPYQSFDNYGSGQVHFDSFYRTSWIDLEQPAVRKRWGHPTFVTVGEADDVLYVDCYRDYDPASPQRQWHINLNASLTGWGEFDVSSWDTVTWGADGREFHVDRSGNIGTARSVQFRFRGPVANVGWGVDSVSLPYLPKRVR